MNELAYNQLIFLLEDFRRHDLPPEAAGRLLARYAGSETIGLFVKMFEEMGKESQKTVDEAISKMKTGWRY